LVSAYETDRRQFSAQMAVRFALALDASMDEFLQRPIQSSQRYDLLFLLVLQDIRHILREATYPAAAVNVLDVSSESMAAFPVFRYSRFWVFTEGHHGSSRALRF